MPLQSSTISQPGMVITVSVEYGAGEPFARDGIQLAVWTAEAARDLNNRVVERERAARAERREAERLELAKSRRRAGKLQAKNRRWAAEL